MPYRITVRDGRSCVRADGEPGSGQCYAEHSDALRYMRALVLNAGGETIPDSHTPGEGQNLGLVKTGPQEGYLDVLGAPFYGPDEGRDSHSQFFSPRTDFLRDYPPFLPTVYYLHGALSGSDATPIGVATDRWTDDAGEWFRVPLDMEDALGMRLWDAALDGSLFASSGVVPASRVVSDDGEIMQWQIGELSLIDLVQGQMPSNMYAMALPHYKAMLDDLEPGQLRLFDGIYAERPVLGRVDETETNMNWMDKFRAAVANLMSMLDEGMSQPMDGSVPIAKADEPCEDCQERMEQMGDDIAKSAGVVSGTSGTRTAPVPVVANNGVATRLNEDERRELEQLRRRTARLEQESMQRTDQAWAEGRVRSGALAPALIPLVVELLTNARRADSLIKADGGQTTVAMVQRLVDESGSGSALPVTDLSLAGFDARTGDEESVDETYVQGMRRFATQPKMNIRQPGSKQ